jgi:hypothetical protein
MQLRSDRRLNAPQHAVAELMGRYVCAKLTRYSEG